MHAAPGAKLQGLRLGQALRGLAIGAAIAALLGEAVAAIDRLVIAWHKRHLRRLPAGRARHRRHLANAAAAAGTPTHPIGGTPRDTAILAAAWLILQTLGGEKLLLSSAENKFLTAVATDERFVLIHESP